MGRPEHRALTTDHADCENQGYEVGWNPVLSSKVTADWKLALYHASDLQSVWVKNAPSYGSHFITEFDVSDGHLYGLHKVTNDWKVAKYDASDLSLIWVNDAPIYQLHYLTELTVANGYLYGLHKVSADWKVAKYDAQDLSLVWVKNAPMYDSTFITEFAVGGRCGPPPAVLHVDASVGGCGGCGESWGDAFVDLQDALTTARNSGGAMQEIRVAAGTYTPDRGTGDRTATFQLLNGVAIYGGFPPGGGDWEDREPTANETILSGDLNGDDAPVLDPTDLLDEPTRAENSYHLVTGSATDSTAILDGFTVSAGNASETGWPDGLGGGMFNNNGSPCPSGEHA